jgi:hypothetical protein
MGKGKSGADDNVVAKYEGIGSSGFHPNKRLSIDRKQAVVQLTQRLTERSPSIFAHSYPNTQGQVTQVDGIRLGGNVSIYLLLIQGVEYNVGHFTFRILHQPVAQDVRMEDANLHSKYGGWHSESCA